MQDGTLRTTPQYQPFRLTFEVGAGILPSTLVLFCPPASSCSLLRFHLSMLTARREWEIEPNTGSVPSMDNLHTGVSFLCDIDTVVSWTPPPPPHCTTASSLFSPSYCVQEVTVFLHQRGKAACNYGVPRGSNPRNACNSWPSTVLWYPAEKLASHGWFQVPNH